MLIVREIQLKIIKNGNNNLIQEEKKKLEKAVVTINYLVEYISSKNGSMPQYIFNSLKIATTSIKVNISQKLFNIYRIKLRVIEKEIFQSFQKIRRKKL